MHEPTSRVDLPQSFQFLYAARGRIAEVIMLSGEKIRGVIGDVSKADTSFNLVLHMAQKSDTRSDAQKLGVNCEPFHDELTLGADKIGTVTWSEADSAPSVDHDSTTRSTHSLVDTDAALASRGFDLQAGHARELQAWNAGPDANSAGEHGLLEDDAVTDWNQFEVNQRLGVQSDYEAVFEKSYTTYLNRTDPNFRKKMDKAKGQSQAVYRLEQAANQRPAGGQRPPVGGGPGGVGIYGANEDERFASVPRGPGSAGSLLPHPLNRQTSSEELGVLRREARREKSGTNAAARELHARQQLSLLSRKTGYTLDTLRQHGYTGNEGIGFINSRITRLTLDRKHGRSPTAASALALPKGEVPRSSVGSGGSPGGNSPSRSDYQSDEDSEKSLELKKAIASLSGSPHPKSPLNSPIKAGVGSASPKILTALSLDVAAARFDRQTVKDFADFKLQKQLEQSRERRQSLMDDASPVSARSHSSRAEREARKAAADEETEMTRDDTFQDIASEEDEDVASLAEDTPAPAAAAAGSAEAPPPASSAGLSVGAEEFVMDFGLLEKTKAQLGPAPAPAPPLQQPQPQQPPPRAPIFYNMPMQPQMMRSPPAHPMAMNPQALQAMQQQMALRGMAPPMVPPPYGPAMPRQPAMAPPALPVPMSLGAMLCKSMDARTRARGRPAAAGVSPRWNLAL